MISAITTSTPIVPAVASFCVGQVTLRNSVRTSIRYCFVSLNQTAGFHCIAPSSTLD